MKSTNKVPHIPSAVKETGDHLVEEDVWKDIAMAGSLVSRAFRLDQFHQRAQTSILGRKEVHSIS